MVTGFNTDVQYDGRTYHVQTEDNGHENPYFESLIYVGGTIIAKKRTSYNEQLRQGATEDTIASLIKRQHQVVIAAIKAGRVEDLVRHSANELNSGMKPVIKVVQPQAQPQNNDDAPEKEVAIPAATARPPARPTDPLHAHVTLSDVPTAPSNGPAAPPGAARTIKSPGLDLNEVISDYLKRSSERARLDLKVLTPRVFTSGKSISLNIQVSYAMRPEAEAVVTVKVIGTAFRPLVFMGRAGKDGIASFSFTLPAFTTGTAAIVIEAQSNRGRGELKHLIRRA
ncbi:MAG: hypothetical protein L0229_27710 [Blastocatellia bacterium]|nr:hypothetical protein [Blastocatellia bacterium]